MILNSALLAIRNAFAHRPSPPVAPKVPRGAYAHAGEQITCENGHHIASFSRDVLWGEMFRASALTDWQQREPMFGEQIPPCERCGARWSGRPGAQGTNFHFADGWRIA